MSRDFARELSFMFLLGGLLVVWVGVFVVDSGAEAGASDLQCRIMEIELDEGVVDGRSYRVVIRLNRPVDYEVVGPSEVEPKVLVKLPRSTELPEMVERELSSGVLKRLRVDSDEDSHTVVELELRRSDVDVTDNIEGDAIHLQLHSRTRVMGEEGMKVVSVY